MQPDGTPAHRGHLDRKQFFEEFSENEASFPHLIYSNQDDREVNSSSRSFITIIYGFEWPTEKGVPIPYSKIDQKSAPNLVVGTLFRTIDFLERHLGVEVRLFDVRSGCVRVRYSFEDTGVDLARLTNSLSRLIGASDAYDISSISANFRGRSVRISS